MSVFSRKAPICQIKYKCMPTSRQSQRGLTFNVPTVDITLFQADSKRSQHPVLGRSTRNPSSYNDQAPIRISYDAGSRPSVAMDHHSIRRSKTKFRSEERRVGE